MALGEETLDQVGKDPHFGTVCDEAAILGDLDDFVVAEVACVEDSLFEDVDGVVLGNEWGAVLVGRAAAQVEESGWLELFA